MKGYVFRLKRALASNLLKKKKKKKTQFTIYKPTLSIYPSYNSHNILFLNFHIMPNTIHFIYLFHYLSLSSPQHSSPQQAQPTTTTIPTIEYHIHIPIPIPKITTIIFATHYHRHRHHHHHTKLAHHCKPQPSRLEPINRSQC